MTPDEMVFLTRYVHALCPAQKFDDYTEEAWMDVLGRFTLAECRAAAATAAGESAFVSAADIAGIARRNRTARLKIHNEIEPPDADPDDPEAYIKALRQERHAVAVGATEPDTRMPAVNRAGQLRLRELTTGLTRDPEDT
jgi:hypothetical protein